MGGTTVPLATEKNDNEFLSHEIFGCFMFKQTQFYWQESIHPIFA